MTGARQPAVRVGVIGGMLAGLALMVWTPSAGAFAPTAAASAATGKATSQPAIKPTQRLDINSASRAQLKKLPHIGDAEADRIIANRPFLTSAEIVDKAGIPAGVYIAIKRQIVAVPKGQPKKAKAAS